MAKTSLKTKMRCPWLKLDEPIYVDYHDKEWGRPVKDDRLLFEMLTLEGAQAGLSWLTVLKKRQRYKEVFYNFDVNKVSKITKREVNQILKDVGIIRNRLKVESTISNAKSFIDVQKEFGSFSDYIWSFTNNKIIYNSFKTLKDYPAKTELSDRISKDLKKRGFRFVGSTIIYAYIQAIGITNDHSKNCYLNRKKIKKI